MKRITHKALFITILIVVNISVFGQSHSYNLYNSTGTISFTGPQYSGEMIIEWNINTGTNKPLQIDYDIDIVNDQEFLYVYAITTEGNAVRVLEVKGAESGSISTILPTGKAKIELRTSGLNQNEYYDGVFLSYTVDYSVSEYSVYNNIYATQSIGIGRTSGSSCNVNIYGNNSQYGVRSVTSSTSNRMSYGLYSAATNNTSSARLYGLYSSVSGTAPNKWSGYFTGGDVEINEGNFKTNGNILMSAGKLGIGTSAPQYPLDVAGNIRSTGEVIISKSNADIGGMLTLENPAKTTAGQASSWKIYNMGGMYGNSLQFWAYDNLDCASGGMCAPRLVLMDNGKIGIGTSTPDEMLTVKGIVHAKEIKIDLSGSLADYVFHPDYNLMPINEIKQFIKANNHLPDIPSAKEVETNGLSIGEMQNKLLQKIEELTLYIIQQNEKIQTLESKLTELESNK
jgi:hypothetical protein